jgi:glycosyltransferase involved in cell wall biosynthesis
MKDHRTFLQAAARAAVTMRNVRFVCVGDEGPILRQDLVTFAASLGLNDIIWSNGRDDIPAVFSACDVVCSSSAYGEGFSNTLAEAMACGRRCIATDVGDAREIIEMTGCIVPPAEEEMLADGIVTLCQEVARCGPNSEAACGRIQENFSIDVMVRRFENEFRRLTT